MALGELTEDQAMWWTYYGVCSQREPCSCAPAFPGERVPDAPGDMTDEAALIAGVEDHFMPPAFRWGWLTLILLLCGVASISAGYSRFQDRPSVWSGSRCST